MTATPPPPWAARPASRWSAGRIVALVLGVLILLPGIGLLAGGGVLLWADKHDRTSAGYVFSPADSFSTDGYALASDTIDLATGAAWLPVSAALGTARIDVTPTDSTKAVFVGIATQAKAAAYLNGVGRTVIADVGTGAGSSAQTVVTGSAPSTPPTEQTFWVAKSSGSGTQRVSWKPTDGNWTLVVMNADGSAGVSVDARAGATLPALGGLAWGVLGAGVACTIVGLLLMTLAIRRRPAGRTGPPAFYGTPPPVPAPRPSWEPPTGADRPAGKDVRRAP
jgi:hypothetical protein